MGKLCIELSRILYRIRFSKIQNALKYNIQDILYFLPIKYYKTRPLLDSNYIIEDYVKCKLSQDMSKLDVDYFLTELYRSMLSKKKEYSFEKEWRFIIHKQSRGEYYFPYVSKIILGKDITKNDEETLIEIATDINLNVYKQYFNLELDKMDYVKVR